VPKFQVLPDFCLGEVEDFSFSKAGGESLI